MSKLGKDRKSEPSRSRQVGGTISKSVGVYFTHYIDNLVSSGRYATVSEVLREALRLHEIQTTQPTGDNSGKSTS